MKVVIYGPLKGANKQEEKASLPDACPGPSTLDLCIVEVLRANEPSYIASHKKGQWLSMQ